jgi:hypothetical protein
MGDDVMNNVPVFNNLLAFGDSLEEETDVSASWGMLGHKGTSWPRDAK